MCRACPRLVRWREDVATEGKRASFADQPYWGRPGPGFGDPEPQVLVVGLAPAANGTNRTGRMFTGDRSGDWLYAALHRAGFASQPHLAWPRRRRPGADRRADRRRRALRAAGQQAHAAGARHLRALARPRPGARGADRAVDARPRSHRLGRRAGQRPRGWAGPCRGPKPRFGHGAEAVLGHRAAARAVRLLGSYHVSQQNTFTGKLTEPMLDAVIARL